MFKDKEQNCFNYITTIKYLNSYWGMFGFEKTFLMNYHNYNIHTYDVVLLKLTNGYVTDKSEHVFFWAFHK